MPAPTDADVIQAAIDELGADFTQYNFVDDASFRAWLQTNLTRIEAQFTGIVVSYTIAIPAFFEAAVYELDAQMLHRIVNQYYSGVLTSESIKLGPLQLAPLKNELVGKDILALADVYHKRARVKLIAGGAPPLKGSIRLYNPATKGNKITII